MLIEKLQMTGKNCFITLLFGLVLGGVSTAGWSQSPDVMKPEFNPDGSIKPPRVVMFKVGDHEFTVQEYVGFLQSNQQLVKRAINTDAGKVRVVRDMAATYVLREELFNEGLLERSEDLKPEEVMKAYEELAKRHFPRGKKPDEKAAYAYYQEHKGRYGIDHLMRLNQILFKVDKGVDEDVKAAIRGRAEKTLKRIRAGESFAELATALTDNPIGKLTQGDIGYVEPEEKPWLKPYVKERQVGDLLDLVESPEGYEILQITAEQPSVVTPFANIYTVVIKDMQDEEQSELRQAYVSKLAKKYKAEVIEPTLKPLLQEGGLFPQ